jgi:hypothetical protein
VTERPVRLILDTSAIIAFTHGSIDVGELIAEIDDEDAAVGIPVLCLVAASHATEDTDRLHLLVHHAASALLDLRAVDWRVLAAIGETVGRLDAAAALLAAIDLRCQILSSDIEWYAGLAGGGPIIPF